MTYYCYFDWPMGRLLLTSDGEALTGILFTDGRTAVSADPSWIDQPDATPLPAARRQLQEYFAGRRREFDLPLRPEGTAFQQRVWSAIAEVPLGETISYRALAERAGSPDASRAAGLATGRNPISIVIPCHRIVGSNGSLTGYGGGLPRKRALLEFEARIAGGARAVLQPQSLFEDVESSRV